MKSLWCQEVLDTAIMFTRAVVVHHTTIISTLQNGKFKFKKEMWHVNYDIKPYSGITIGSTMDKWIGFKGVVYNLLTVA